MDNSNKIIEFTLVYNKHKQAVYNYVLKMIGNKMQCEDIVQNVFLKLFENLDNIKNKSSVNFWIFSTARNEVYGLYRAKKVRVDQFGVADTEDIELESERNLVENYEMKELKELIMKELDSLPEDQKDVYLLKEYGGFSYKEIAGISGVSEDLVKSRLFKTRQKLIKRISKKVA
ncbi:MAG: RNA polymerase sigma factor [Melioribacteraceae bacterium]|nr:RNA polymerase sigma factor [Melioribacteraceae bacterium]MCF8263574.1 RNA polymerase sigma factor [Melioribacteraceae bacterium]MCF8412433.1 RNA polymerase sigma factor [Melioribacteraceae bacterium]MCF8430814.1 RNA polymerase sigma factor [Melioribacteraceae bacterium]